jgi:ADP-ribosyl-[dinitrogen reductase] hydrolase
MIRTSQTDPLRIAAVTLPSGLKDSIGITLCPGKKDSRVPSGAWARDLELDIAAIRDWGADVVLTLVEPHELTLLDVEGIGEVVRRHGMTWLHLPIRDASVPDTTFERAWLHEGRRLRTVLRRGGKVLVHCRGGLGRAGMIAARLLVEVGEAPSEAVRKVRAARPGAIETSGQEDHVRSCQAADFDQDEAAGRRDRAVGCFLGLAVGDAIGTTLEFQQRDTYPDLTDMVGGGPFGLRPGEWTDDTSMALCLAESLLAHPGLDAHDLMSRFLRWWRNGENASNGRCFDIGITTREALARFLETGNPVAGSTHPRSAGNGSIMRLAPVAVRWWGDRAEAARVARAQSTTTHGAASAVAACACFAELLIDGIVTGDKAAALAARYSAEPTLGPVAAGSWKGKARSEIRSGGYVIETIEAALWSVGNAGSFEEAILLAANLGDDADTVGAVTGQIAGALWGSSGIPQRWLDRLAQRHRLEDIADRLFAAGSI